MAEPLNPIPWRQRAQRPVRGPLPSPAVLKIITTGPLLIEGSVSIPGSVAPPAEQGGTSPGALWMARFTADLFGMAGSHIGFDVSALNVAQLGDSAKAGLLAAAIELRAFMEKTPEGREALRKYGYRKGENQ